MTDERPPAVFPPEVSPPVLTAAAPSPAREGIAAMTPSLGVALGAIAISFAPVFVEGIDPNDLGPTGIALYRTGIGAVLLFALAVLRREPCRPSRGALALAATAGALFAGDLWVWHRAIHRVGGGMATILGNTQVFWVALAGVLLHGEKASRRLLLALPLALVGVALLTGVIGGSAASRADPVGVGLGLATSLFYAAYILTLRRGRGKPGAGTAGLGPIAFMAWVSLACATTSGLLAAVDGSHVTPSKPSTWALLGGLAFVGQLLGWVTIATFLPRVPASRAGLLLLLQPTFSVVWAAIFFGRTLGPLPLLGAALTLVAIYVGSTSGYPLPSPGEKPASPTPSPRGEPPPDPAPPTPLP